MSIITLPSEVVDNLVTADFRVADAGAEGAIIVTFMITWSPEPEFIRHIEPSRNDYYEGYQPKIRTLYKIRLESEAGDDRVNERIIMVEPSTYGDMITATFYDDEYDDMITKLVYVYKKANKQVRSVTPINYDGPVDVFITKSMLQNIRAIEQLLD